MFSNNGILSIDLGKFNLVFAVGTARETNEVRKTLMQPRSVCSDLLAFASPFGVIIGIVPNKARLDEILLRR